MKARNANLRPWPKGKSGNPKGRPKGRTLTEDIRAELAKAPPPEILRKYRGLAGDVLSSELLAVVVVRKALQGDFRYFKEIIDRMDGKTAQPIALKNEAPLTLNEFFCRMNEEAEARARARGRDGQGPAPESADGPKIIDHGPAESAEEA